ERLGVLIERVGLDDDVRDDASAAAQRAAAVGAEDPVGRRIIVPGSRSVVSPRLLLDEPPAGRVPLAGGELERPPAVQRVDVLDQPLAERGGADDDRAVVVLERARHDLGGGGGVAVHEDDDRLVADDGAAAGAVLVRRLVAVADGDDGLPALEEEVADVHGRVETAAAVAAQVDDEGGRALPPQRAHRLCDLLAGVLVEALERDVAHAVVEEDRERHGRDVDDGAGEAAADRLVHPRPYERDLDLGAGPAEQAAGHLLQLQAAGGLAVNLDDAVARAHGAALRGRVGEHAGDGGDAALVLDLHAEPAVGGADLLAGEAGDLLGRVQCGV